MSFLGNLLESWGREGGVRGAREGWGAAAGEGGPPRRSRGVRPRSGAPEREGNRLGEREVRFKENG